MDTFVIGDIVSIKPEWLNPGESADVEFMVVDVTMKPNAAILNQSAVTCL